MSCSEDSDFYEVERILDERKNPTNGKIEYLVKWMNYPRCQSTWQEANGFEKGAALVVREWKAKKKQKMSNEQRKLRGKRKSTCFWNGKTYDDSDDQCEANLKTPPLKLAKTGEGNYQVSPTRLEKPENSFYDNFTPSTSKATLSTDMQSVFGALKRNLFKDADQLEQQTEADVGNQGQDLEEQFQDKSEGNELLLQMEILQLKEQNRKLKESLGNLGLFMLNRKSPEKKLLEENAKLVEQLTVAEVETNRLRVELEESHQHLTEAEKVAEDRKGTLENVARVFCLVMGQPVSYEQVQFVLPAVQEKILTCIIKAETLEQFESRSLLME